MPTIQAAGRLVTASAEDRILEYDILPFGEEGATNVGGLTASAGTVELPADPAEIKLNLEHSYRSPVATAASITELPDRIRARFRVAATTAGDDLLVEAADGLRTGASVELADAVIRAGRLIRSRLVGVAAVVRPAFPTARLVTAADAGDLDEDDQDDAETDVDEDQDDAETGDVETDDAPASPPQEDSMPMPQPATAPAEITAGRTTSPTSRREPVTARQVSELLAAAHSTKRPELIKALGAPEIAGDGEIFAALTSIKHDGTGAPGNNQRQPGWLGHIWQGKRYTRKYVSLLRQVPLTAYELKGWKFGTKPGGDTWTGNKTAVPSGTITTTPHTFTASKWAGAHDHAREYVDFPNPDYWDAYWAAMADDYALDSDTAGLTTLTTGATAVEVEAADIPTDRPEGLVKIVDGVLATLDYGTASYAVMAADLWRDFVLTPTDGALEFLTASTGLESGSFEGFRIVPSSDMTAGSVLVGTREAADFRELPGVPLRVEGLDMVNGGIDTGLFGYHMTKIDEPLGLALVTTAPAA